MRGSVGRWLADNRRAVPIVLSFVATTRLREMLSRSSCRCPQLLLLRTEFAYASPSILSIQRWTISIRARFPLKILVQCNFITLFLIVQNLYSGWDDDWRVIVVRFVHFYFIAIFCFTSIQEQRRNRIDIHRVQTIYVNDREREEKKRCSIQKCANTEFSLSLSLVLMRSSRPFRDFFERFTLCMGGERKGRVSWSQATKGISILNPIGPTVPSRERRLRENGREDAFSLSLFLSPFSSL